MSRVRGPARGRALAVLLLAAIAVPACATPAPPLAAQSTGDVVIDEVVAGTSADPDASSVELRNLSAHAVDLSGWRLYRCTGEGTRLGESEVEADLAGVVLAAGERLVIGSAGGDRALRGPFSADGYGLVLEDARHLPVDAFAAYPRAPWPTDSECGAHGTVPDTLAAGLDESWQRVARTGDPDVDWVRTRSTPGAQGAVVAAASAPSVVIAEIAPAGPAAADDDVVELANATDAAVDLSGWSLYRCTRDGSLTAGTRQVVFADGTAIEPGERLAVGGPGYAGAADVRTATSLADTVSGALLVTDDGVRVDGVTISAHADTACQTGDEKLPAVLDHRTGESWQRADGTGDWIVAPRTPGERNADADSRVATDFAYPAEPGVAISEIATDPVVAELDSPRNLVELANYGAEPVAIGGWRLIGCDADGFRERAVLAEIPAGERLAPGATWTATAEDGLAHPLGYQGSGVWLEDTEGARVDSVGIFHANELDAPVDVASPCTKGLALSTFGVDRLAGETWQRAAFTGDDATDFVPARATPDAAPLRERADVLSARAQERIAATVPVTAVDEEPTPTDASAEGVDTAITAVWAGAADGPLAGRAGADERPLDASAAALDAADDGWAHPFLRFELAAGSSGRVAWSGVVTGPAPVRLSAWTDGGWRALDERTASADGTVTLAGELPSGADAVLVQIVPRTEAIRDAADGLADPSDYDLALSHLTDTQYLTEAHPAVALEQAAWVAANAEARRIAFAVHTGDLVQNWVDAAQDPARAEREFALASAAQAVIEGAGVPVSTLPGNHDSKRGATVDLYNDWFGPDRYADDPAFGGAIAPDDASASWSSFTAARAEFVVLSLPYAYGERELAWAEGVVAGHPHANVIVATHEHLLPEDGSADAERATSNRWVSRADELWERIVAPNRNVVLVLSGHYHGLARIETADAGGIPGHDVVEILGDYQDFRTSTGMRATGFQRILQVAVASGEIAVDTLSTTLGERTSAPYDYPQAVEDDGRDTTGSSDRPWRIVAEGLQGRYDAADDDFRVTVRLQYAKGLETTGIVLD
ncbi:lamin tail domain-containing protein [Microbacterium gilvum]|uniref:LTD domain-containing protein n=1 Tax=Microbacterium gilvum TaxID=1336204 RepID=A0ABP8ZSL7_9MICO